MSLPKVYLNGQSNQKKLTPKVQAAGARVLSRCSPRARTHTLPFNTWRENEINSSRFSETVQLDNRFYFSSRELFSPKRSFERIQCDLYEIICERAEYEKLVHHTCFRTGPATLSFRLSKLSGWCLTFLFDVNKRFTFYYVIKRSKWSLILLF